MHAPRKKNGASASPSDQELLNWLGDIHPAILKLDARGTVEWISPGFELWCEGSQRWRGRPLREFFVDATQAEAWEKHAASKNRMRAFSAVLSNARGETLELELHTTPFPRGEEAQVTIVVARKPSDQHIILSPDAKNRATCTELALAVLNSSLDAVLVLDEQGFVAYANPAFEALFQIDAQRILQQPIGLLAGATPGNNLKRIVTAIRPGETGCVYGQNLKFDQRNGVSVYLSISASDLISPGENFGGRVVFLRDVTERVLIRKQLEAKNTELENYVHTVSHDLRSPLVALLGFTKLLRREYGERLDETGLHFLDRIEQASRNMESLISHLLEFSRIGGVVEAKFPTDVLGIFQQLKAELKPRLEAQGIELRLPDEAPLALCDHSLMYQVFANLLVNAIDHMGEIPAPQIRVEIREAGHELQISVRDNGQGIDPKDHARIFEIFQSLHRRSDGTRGSGIGLAIVKKIVEAHGGSVGVASEPGHGACFTISLPRS